MPRPFGRTGASPVQRHPCSEQYDKRLIKHKNFKRNRTHREDKAGDVRLG